MKINDFLISFVKFHQNQPIDYSNVNITSQLMNLDIQIQFSVQKGEN